MVLRGEQGIVVMPVTSSLRLCRQARAVPVAKEGYCHHSQSLPGQGIHLCHRGTHARVVVAAAQRGADRSCQTWRTTRCRCAHVRVRCTPSADQIMWSPDRRRTAILAGLPQLQLWSRQCHQWRHQPPLRWRTGHWSMADRLPAGTSTCSTQTRLVQWDHKVRRSQGQAPVCTCG